MQQLEGVQSLRDFDERITLHYMGFSGADDYYDKASAMHVLDRIAIPTLVIHADDDPYVLISEASRHKLHENPNVVFLNPQYGGHVGFIADSNGTGDDGYWAERKIARVLCLDRTTLMDTLYGPFRVPRQRKWDSLRPEVKLHN